MSTSSKTLVIYLIAGERTPELAVAAVEGGADVLEIGFPFSDPLAEGPVIRKASERALAAGIRTDRCLECLALIRHEVANVPLIPMTYAAILEAYGYERFDAEARRAGATSLILVDMPMGDRPDLERIRMIAPTSSDERIHAAAELTDGWLYVVAVTGTTGVREGVSSELVDLASRARLVAGGIRLYAGFGISTPEQARESARYVDGVVIGSRAVQVSEEGPLALERYVAAVRRALDGA